MNIIVPIKQVPDLVEELEIDESGTSLNREWLKFKINEFDDHALEEALQLKEEAGGTVTAIALNTQDIDKTLYTAAAKGADRLVKITGDFGEEVSSRTAARALASVIKDIPYDLILTGVQAADDRDGQVGVMLAQYLNIPCISVVTGVSLDGGQAIVHKEYSGGVMGEFEVELPAVLGVQAARQTPRYAPVSRVRQAMRSTELDEIAAGDISMQSGSKVLRMFKPQTSGHAEMLEGSAEEVAEKITAIIKERGIK